jgi:heme/copper-type cytochrome/quinol oxidase subunit 2
MSLPVAVFAIAAVACAIAHVAILVSVVRRASGPVSPEVPRPKLAIEIMWAMIPLIVLAFVLTATWDRVRERESPSGVLLEVAR